MKVIWRRIAFWGVLCAVVLASLAYAFRPVPIPVDLTTVARGPLLVTIEEEGETRVRDIFELSSPITGRARRIELEVGDLVIAEETVVAEIEPLDPVFLDLRSAARAEAEVHTAEAARTLAAAALDQAQAELDFATAELGRAHRLIRNETISQRALDNAEREFRTRKAAVATAKAALDMGAYELERARAELMTPRQAIERHGACDCIAITAPVSGRILRIFHKSAGVVEAGQRLAEIGDPRDLEIVVDLLSSDAVKVEAGQEVIISEWGGAKPLAGRVARVEPSAFTKVSALGIEEQRVNVIVALTEAPERWLRLGHGFRTELRIVIWRGDQVLKLPLSALFRDGEDWAVFVAEAGRARWRGVRLGRLGGFQAEVLGGLEAGETVVLHPSDRVGDGARIAGR